MFICPRFTGMMTSFMGQKTASASQSSMIKANRPSTNFSGPVLLDSTDEESRKLQKKLDEGLNFLA